MPTITSQTFLPGLDRVVELARVRCRCRGHCGIGRVIIAVGRGRARVEGNALLNGYAFASFVSRSPTHDMVPRPVGPSVTNNPKAGYYGFAKQARCNRPRRNTREPADLCQPFLTDGLKSRPSGQKSA